MVLLFVILRQCNSATQQRQSQESATEFLNDTIAYYQNKLGQQVAEKKAIQGDKATLEILLSKQIDSTGQLKRLVSKYKNIAAAGNITQETKIDTVEIPYEAAVPFEFTREFTKQTDYYSITGTSNQNGVTLNDIQIPNSLSFAIGKKRTGFFRSEYRIEAVNSNPYVQTTGLDSYTLKVPTKRLGLSLYAGYGVGSNFTLQPSAGIALTYTLFRL
ncbi:MAG: hypothetical protein CMH22_01060 [Methylophaga sp.]|nr:hypothetical protein [Methylophaga sp.]